MDRKAEMIAALEAAKGNVRAAFEFIQASGRATKALQSEFEHIERLRADLEQAETQYAKRAAALAKRKAEKAEAKRIAAQLSKDWFDIQKQSPSELMPRAEDEDEDIEVNNPTVDDANVTWGQPNPDFRLSPGTVENALYFVKKNIRAMQIDDAELFKPFWVNCDETTEQALKSIKITTEWDRLDKFIVQERFHQKPGEVVRKRESDDLQGPFYLKKIEGKMLFFEVPANPRLLRLTTAKFSHGVLITNGNGQLPPLIQTHLVDRFKIAQKLDNAFLQSVISIIPGIFQAEKRGKGRLNKDGTFVIVNVNDSSLHFKFKVDRNGNIALFATPFAGYMDRATTLAYDAKSDAAEGGRWPLTKITYENALKIANAWEEYDRSNVQLTILGAVSRAVRRGESQYAPHVAVMDTLEEDNFPYVDRVTAEGNKAEEKRQTKIILDRKREEYLRGRIMVPEGVRNGSIVSVRKFLIMHDGTERQEYEFYRVVDEGEITDGKGGLYVRYYKKPLPQNRRGRLGPENLQNDVVTLYKFDLMRDKDAEFVNGFF